MVGGHLARWTSCSRPAPDVVQEEEGNRFPCSVEWEMFLQINRTSLWNHSQDVSANTLKPAERLSHGISKEAETQSLLSASQETTRSRRQQHWQPQANHAATCRLGWPTATLIAQGTVRQLVFTRTSHQTENVLALAAWTKIYNAKLHRTPFKSI